MSVYNIVSAIVVGVVAGLLGRLIIPRRHRIGVFATLVIGIAAAFLGYFAAGFANVSGRDLEHIGRVHWDWAVLALQVGIAVLGVALASALTAGRPSNGPKPGNRRAAANRRRRNSPKGTCA